VKLQERDKIIRIFGARLPIIFFRVECGNIGRLVRIIRDAVELESLHQPPREGHAADRAILLVFFEKELYGSKKGLVDYVRLSNFDRHCILEPIFSNLETNLCHLFDLFMRKIY